MSRDKIINYYLLCTVRMGRKAHIIDDIKPKDLEIIFTKKEIELYLRKHDGCYIAREIVVGGDEMQNTQNAQRYTRMPVVII